MDLALNNQERLICHKPKKTFLCTHLIILVICVHTFEWLQVLLTLIIQSNIDHLFTHNLI